MNSNSQKLNTDSTQSASKICAINRTATTLKIGSVLVVGGGIAGIQSALDLADAGFKVYLLTNDVAIGGRMVQLDKTFPTNDCSMCMISPKLVTIGNHPNVEIITKSQVESLHGDVGNFKVTLRKYPKYIDETKCTSCEECAKVCPVTVPDTFNFDMSKRKAAYKLYPQAVPNKFAIDKIETAPCKNTCPAHISVQGYVALIAQGRFADALKVVRDRIPFPSVCGRVCYHPCEDECKRGEVDEPIAINALKRFVADVEMKEMEERGESSSELPQPLDSQPAAINPQPLTLSHQPSAVGSQQSAVGNHQITKLSNYQISHQPSAINPQPLTISPQPSTISHQPSAINSVKVAVIGSGPAGLTCAHDLAKLGYSVIVFESLPVPGGMLAVGIPEYRLFKKVLNYEIERIKKLKIEIKTNITVGSDISIDNLKSEGFAAFFIAVGAHKNRKMGIEGEDLNNVISGVEFLRKINLKESVVIGNKVAVIGGGNVAIDAARTAVRLGCKDVNIIYRRSRDEMPAHSFEIEEAEREGVKFNYLLAPTQIIGKNGEAVSIECVKMQLGEPDASGRRRPEPIKNSEITIEVDTIIPAIGQISDSIWSIGIEGEKSDVGQSEELKSLIKRDGIISVNPVTMATSIPNIFAGGDVTTGPSMVINAIAAGKQAAVSIDRYLKSEDLTLPRYEDFLIPSSPLNHTTKETVVKKARQYPQMLPVEQRLASFQEVEMSLSEQQAIEEASRCLNCGICSECMECVRVCKQEAINHQQKEVLVDLNVGAIILATGFEPFNAEVLSQYGYGRISNVVTSLEFERLLSASGPTLGHIVRPSDHKEPRKIAFLQCIGSRDESIGNSYCSSVCCMYATKEAIIAKEHVQDLDITIFYMDIRAHGKGFERYYESAKNENGIKYVRCMISGIKEFQKTKNLLLKYANQSGEILEEEFDIIVLSVGLIPSRGTQKMCEMMGVKLNRFGFCETDLFLPTVTSRKGIFVSGVFQAPKDIPETVIQASSAACEAENILAESRGTLIVEKELPPEKNVDGEAPRIGVLVCRCGFNIGAVVDVPAVVEFAKGLPNVVFAEEKLYACAQDSLSIMKNLIEEQNLNRLVVSSCTPRTHLPLFQQAVREGGLNKYLFEMANIREHDSWVHRDEPDKATEKAKSLVSSAVAKAALLKPLQQLTSPVTQKALVIGGGLSGMTSALALAEQGFETYLLEKEAELGGSMRKLHYTLDGKDVQKYLNTLIEHVKSNDKIKVFLGSTIKSVDGHVGHFKTKLTPAISHQPSATSHQPPIELEHGIIIVATGGEEYKPKEYLYGQDERIFTQTELEKILAEYRTENTDSVGSQQSAVSNYQITKLPNYQITNRHQPSAFSPQSPAPRTEIGTVVMIQCVGSRNKEREYCSRICCGQAVKNALKIKEINPDARVFVLYRDIRTFGFREDYYRIAREKGVIFIKFNDSDNPTIVKENGSLVVKVNDVVLRREVEIKPDIVVLSAALLPSFSNQELSPMLKVPIDKDGFFLEAHIKLRPVEFANEGMFLCGLAHSPKFFDEDIAQAKAAVSRASIVLSKEYLNVEGAVANVSPDLCAACLTCVRVCPYSVPFINEKGKAEIVAVKCQGCGTCVSHCPAKAIQLEHFRDEQVLEQCEALLEACLVC